MTNEDELRFILEEVATIRKRAEESFGVEELLQRDRPRLQRLLTEAKAFVAEELGDDNDFAGYLAKTIDRTMHRDAAPSHADEGFEYIEGALNLIRRKRRREAELNGESIPASDRYVSISDNQRAALAEDISSLGNAIQGSNEGSEEERQIALYEVAIIQATVAAPIASSELIERFVNWVQKVMLKVFAGAVVAEVAQRLIHALLALL